VVCGIAGGRAPIRAGLASDRKMAPATREEVPSGFSMAPLLAASPSVPQSVKRALLRGQRACAAALLVSEVGLSPADACELVR